MDVAVFFYANINRSADEAEFFSESVFDETDVRVADSVSSTDTNDKFRWIGFDLAEFVDMWVLGAFAFDGAVFFDDTHQEFA